MSTSVPPIPSPRKRSRADRVDEDGEMTQAEGDDRGGHRRRPVGGEGEGFLLACPDPMSPKTDGYEPFRLFRRRCYRTCAALIRAKEEATSPSVREALHLRPPVISTLLKVPNAQRATFVCDHDSLYRFSHHQLD